MRTHRDPDVLRVVDDRDRLLGFVAPGFSAVAIFSEFYDKPMTGARFLRELEAGNLAVRTYPSANSEAREVETQTLTSRDYRLFCAIARGNEADILMAAGRWLAEGLTA